MYIGNKVQKLRQSQKMTLSTLSAKSGVQLATLSRIEHMKMTGTLDSHMKIAKALGIDVTQLYSEVIKDNNKADVKNNDSETDIFFYNEKSSSEILTSNILSKKMMPTLIKIENGGRTSIEQKHIGSEKFAFILEGKVDVKIESKTYPISKDNTLYFNASLKHCFINTGKTAAKILWVATPVSL